MFTIDYISMHIETPFDAHCGELSCVWMMLTIIQRVIVGLNDKPLRLPAFVA